jgi:hypothetical protein
MKKLTFTMTLLSITFTLVFSQALLATVITSEQEFSEGLKPIQISTPIEQNLKIISKDQLSKFSVQTQDLLLTASLANQTKDWKPRLSNAYKRSLEVVYNWHQDPSFDFALCVSRPGVLAFNYVGTPNIYLCRSFFDLSEGAKIQIMVHEIAHAAGEANECMATSYEIMSVLGAGWPIYYRNGYWSECGYLGVY